MNGFNLIYPTENNLCVSVVMTDSLFVTCEVPQGFVLGPLLFLLCINDLPNASKFLTLPHVFADDTSIYCSCKNLND